MDSLLQAAGVTVLATLALSTFILAFDKLAPDRLVQERHDLALAAIIMVPSVFLIALMPRTPSATPPVYLQTVEIQTMETGQSAPPQTLAPASITTPQAGPPRPFWSSWPVAGIAVAIWFSGAFWMLARLSGDAFKLAMLRKRSQTTTPPQTLKLSQPVSFRRSKDIRAPMLAGYIRPEILVPKNFRFEGSAAPVLEHEIAHLVRRDAWIVMLVRIVTATFWWAVPLYPLCRVLNRNRETLCDRRAARITRSPHELAHALLDAAADQARAPALALAATPNRSDLASRIAHLSSPDVTQTRDSVMRLSLLLPVLAVSALVFTPKVGAVPDSVNSSKNESGFDRVFSDDPTPLFRAARRGRLADLRRLLAAGEDPNEISRGDGTALMAAVDNSHDDIVQELLRAGADPNIAVRGDGTALIFAARSGDTSLVNLLLAADADPNLGLEGDGSPLISASRRGHADIVGQLLQNGAEIDFAVPGDGNPLIGASLGGHHHIVELLLNAGADANAYVPGDETPLINAAQSGSITVAEALVARGADISLTVAAQTRDGETEYRSPLSEAERMNQGAMASWLAARGAEHRPPSN
jgi:ankyrin repeat protein/beta-lactamase regulating signal transducer with metallopeptidase domain